MNIGIKIGILLTILSAIFGYFAYQGAVRHLGFFYGVVLTLVFLSTCAVVAFAMLIIRINRR